MVQFDPDLLAEAIALCRTEEFEVKVAGRRYVTADDANGVLTDLVHEYLDLMAKGHKDAEHMLACDLATFREMTAIEIANWLWEVEYPEEVQ